MSQFSNVLNVLHDAWLKVTTGQVFPNQIHDVNTSRTIRGLSPTLFTQILILLSSILTGGFRYYHSKTAIRTNHQRGVLDHTMLSSQEGISSVAEHGTLSTTTLSTTPSSSSSSSSTMTPSNRNAQHNPFFGERPHYFMPPSDMEQYRTRSTSVAQHFYIPYPNDPPHTFPSIKARSLFTKSPKKLSQVYIERIDPVNRSNLRSGAKLKVPIQQLEERFRTVYTNAKDNGLEITMNVKKNLNSQDQFEKLGFYTSGGSGSGTSDNLGSGNLGSSSGSSSGNSNEFKTISNPSSTTSNNTSPNMTYDFHHVDGLITPPLYRLE
ncbi:hypothetical protein C9374_005749 [Naegleria lovaniensis]|uniref:Uncharacterized protein n=1 Tax=Naegleria lovaniensis TaxID=51637 RepID=A0AA88GP83_NAELO|nr:uncharacterized protein C9374_005749 [Naegleria lovaniensis]KAG2381957.1 hypothetical protein C9374_005749 [Naegleria lovaniensis]